MHRVAERTTLPSGFVIDHAAAEAHVMEPLHAQDKGPNIGKITFAQLMTHKAGFRVTGSDTFYSIMKAQVAGGVTNANLGAYSYQNMNFSLCRILIAVMNGVISANTTFPAPFEDQFWDYVTITAYENYVAQKSVPARGRVRPHADAPWPGRARLRFPGKRGLGLRRPYCGFGWDELAHVRQRASERHGLLTARGHDHVAFSSADHAR